jgi:hypothetical protein
MKFFTAFLLIGLISFVGCIYFPWWSIAIVSFIVGVLIPQKPLWSFLSAFLSLFILWFAITYWISIKNEYVLAHKISLLILKKDSPEILMLLTALMGALVAGFGSLSGALLRRPQSNKEENRP